MRIRFHKISSERHALEILRPGQASERVECETRSFLTHDLLHYAIESGAGLAGGFWGSLAQGISIPELTKAAAMEFADPNSEIAQIEKLVGPLTALTKGAAPQEILAHMTAQAAEIGSTLPTWLTEGFIVAVRDKMHHLLGQWKATPFGSWMELDWPDGFTPHL